MEWVAVRKQTNSLFPWRYCCEWWVITRNQTAKWAASSSIFAAHVYIYSFIQCAQMYTRTIHSLRHHTYHWHLNSNDTSKHQKWTCNLHFLLKQKTNHNLWVLDIVLESVVVQSSATTMRKNYIGAQNNGRASHHNPTFTEERSIFVHTECNSIKQHKKQNCKTVFLL